VRVPPLDVDVRGSCPLAPSPKSGNAGKTFDMCRLCVLRKKVECTSCYVSAPASGQVSIFCVLSLTKNLNHHAFARNSPACCINSHLCCMQLKSSLTLRIINKIDSGTITMLEKSVWQNRRSRDHMKTWWIEFPNETSGVMVPSITEHLCRHVNAWQKLRIRTRLVCLYNGRTVQRQTVHIRTFHLSDHWLSTVSVRLCLGIRWFRLTNRTAGRAA
jgi:hypothetical protein